MNFREWLQLDEIPHAFFQTAYTQFLPDERNEARRITFNLIDVRTELLCKGNPEAYKQANKIGFNAKFPFSNDYLVCYGPQFDSKVYKTRIGKPDENLTMLSPDWYKYAQFMMGNTLVYWAVQGVYQPTDMAVTA